MDGGCTAGFVWEDYTNRTQTWQRRGYKTAKQRSSGKNRKMKVKIMVAFKSHVLKASQVD